MTHSLDENISERAYFLSRNPNGRAAYRHAIQLMTGGLPVWARDKRANRTSIGQVTTMEITSIPDITSMEITTIAEITAEEITSIPVVEDWRTTGGVDPLTML
ncbi:hypothetical protein [Caballeronia sordidicola]|uniref:hypothetical protein n=1 Tax=Caballeronia sordidicola TaxID=196367 RepID=UPI00117E364F|nr:hypothetical protein [Caballeronia sordidicola]